MNDYSKENKIKDHVFVPEGDAPFNCMVCIKCGGQASKHIDFDDNPIKDLFNMVYMWGKVGVHVDETAPAFQDSLQSLIVSELRKFTKAVDNFEYERNGGKEYIDSLQRPVL